MKNFLQSKYGFGTLTNDQQKELDALTDDQRNAYQAAAKIGVEREVAFAAHRSVIAAARHFIGHTLCGDNSISDFFDMNQPQWALAIFAGGENEREREARKAVRQYIIEHADVYFYTVNMLYANFLRTHKFALDFALLKKEVRNEH